MDFISVIPARAGSKGIKNKNVLKLNNKPLIEYTFKEVEKSEIKKNYLLTDSKKIKSLSKKYQINNDYIRPKSHSGNKTSLIKTLSHFYEWTKLRAIQFDYIVVLQPTSPLRLSKDINQALRIIRKEKSLSLFSVSESLEHPYETINIINKKKWSFSMKNSKKFYRRQDFDLKSFFINGAIYIVHKSLLSKKKIFNFLNHSFYKMPKNRSLEINDISEAKIVESILKNRGHL